LLGQRLTFTVYPGRDGSHSLFEDDGLSFDYRRGSWLGIDATWDEASAVLTLSQSPGSQAPAVARPVSVRLAGSANTEDANFSGAALRFSLRRAT
jgi:alpha-D-xyloside xylohydrolase